MQINATLRIRSISQATLDTILEMLREESNAVFVETFPTIESPRPAGVLAPIVTPPSLTPSREAAARAQHPAGRGLGASESKRRGHLRAV